MKETNFGFGKEVTTGFKETLEKIPEVLKEEGFGVLTEIDVQETLKKKLDVNFRKYKILGACNPPFAHKALESNPLTGMLLPCNIIVFENGEGNTEVWAMDPIAVMGLINNPDVKTIAAEVRKKIENVLESLT